MVKNLQQIFHYEKLHIFVISFYLILTKILIFHLFIFIDSLILYLYHLTPLYLFTSFFLHLFTYILTSVCTCHLRLPTYIPLLAYSCYLYLSTYYTYLYPLTSYPLHLSLRFQSNPVFNPVIIIQFTVIDLQYMLY